MEKWKCKLSRYLGTNKFMIYKMAKIRKLPRALLKEIQQKSY